jgi:hypothetical protein
MTKTIWYKIIGILKSTYMSCKQESKIRCRILLHQNKGSQKQRTPTIHVESNIQSFIKQCVDVMLHQMKGIRDEKQDVHLFL